jgi:hypothetical protein
VSTRIDAQARLALPEGLFEVTAAGDDADVRRGLGEMYQQMMPRLQPEDRDTLVEGLMAWRARLEEHGVVSHGVVNIPTGTVVDGESIGTPVHWHLLTAVVHLPGLDELHGGEVLHRMVAGEFDPEYYYDESFTTAQGWGYGVVTSLPVTPPAGVAADVLPVFEVLGVSAALTADPDGLGLLTIGLAFDAERTVQMASLVAGIISSSTVTAA